MTHAPESLVWLEQASRQKRWLEVAAVVAFGFYDGPEDGLAVSASGAGVRFSSLGDSRSGLLRAFELTPLEGAWLDQVQALRKACGALGTVKVLAPTPGEEVDRLNALIRNDAPVGSYVGVGSSWFDGLRVAPATVTEVARLRSLPHPDSFRATHQHVKQFAGS